MEDDLKKFKVEYLRIDLQNCTKISNFSLTLSVTGCRRTLEVTGGGYYDHGLKTIFFDRFLAVSLHISIEIYIRTFHAKGFVSSFKTLALRALQKSSRKARKSSDRKFIKGKSSKIDGPQTSDGRQTRPRPARALIFFFKRTVMDIH